MEYQTLGHLFLYGRGDEDVSKFSFGKGEGVREDGGVRGRVEGGGSDVIKDPGKLNLRKSRCRTVVKPPTEVTCKTRPALSPSYVERGPPGTMLSQKMTLVT